jgi:hypothetical protein
MIAGEERKEKKDKIRSTCYPTSVGLQEFDYWASIKKKEKRERKSAVKGARHQTLVRRDGSEVRLGVDVRTVRAHVGDCMIGLVEIG